MSKAMSLLGRKTGYPDRYSPDLLEALPRSEGRGALGLGDSLPFGGADLWNAWELTWLNGRGRPEVAVARIIVPAESPRIVESKSLKLYLNSFAMTAFADADAVATTIAADVIEATGSSVDVRLEEAEDARAAGLDLPPGTNIDDADIECTGFDVDASLLRADANCEASECLHSDLFRSNCPVTGQPDYATIIVRYQGPMIDRGALLRYLVSYRTHCAFHENCIERIFCDLKDRCGPARLTVYGRFTRRGGIDINPFRSDWEDDPEDLRLWRQ